MRCLVISDIHANFVALQGVLEDAQPFDEIWCIGDVVGYGPKPNECIERLRDFPLKCIAGNHDWGAIGRADLLVFHDDARQILYWTQEQLTPENLTFLSSLSTLLTHEGYWLAHGSPRDPIWEYSIDAWTALQNFLKFDFQIAFVGHTHIPVTFEWLEDSQQVKILLPDLDQVMPLEGRRLIINPGSVGQPRDGDPRASYGILDTEAQTWEARRLPYPVEETQQQMRDVDLPQRMIDRLLLGR